jgi:hypothetical protein
MEKGIERLIEVILKDGGERPLVFLDTGTVIEWEKELKQNSNRHLNSTWLYSKLGEKLPLYVPECSMLELQSHHLFNRVNRRKEISNETIGIISRLHSEYCKYLKQQKDNEKDIEKIRYDVYFAGDIAHVRRGIDCPKKSQKEPLSRVDRGLLETAIYLRYGKVADEIDTTSSIVLTTDDLIQKTAEVLCDRNFHVYDQFGGFGYEGLRAINTSN